MEDEFSEGSALEEFARAVRERKAIRSHSHVQDLPSGCYECLFDELFPQIVVPPPLRFLALPVTEVTLDALIQMRATVALTPSLQSSTKHTGLWEIPDTHYLLSDHDQWNEAVRRCVQDANRETARSFGMPFSIPTRNPRLLIMEPHLSFNATSFTPVHKETRAFLLVHVSGRRTG